MGVGTVFFVALPLVEAHPVTRLPDSWISREWQWRERTNRGRLPTQPNRPRLVVYDPTAEIEPGLSSYGEQVEVVAYASMDQVIDEVHKTPAHAVLVGADSVVELLPLAARGRAAAAGHAPAGLGAALAHGVGAACRRRSLPGQALEPGRTQRAIGGGAPAAAAGPGRRRRRRSAAPAGAHARPARRETWSWRRRPTGKRRCGCSHEQDFDLLLLDMMMPRRNGLQVLEALRHDARTCAPAGDHDLGARPVCNAAGVQRDGDYAGGWDPTG